MHGLTAMSQTACTPGNVGTTTQTTRADLPDGITIATPEEFVAGVSEFIAAEPSLGAFLTEHDASELADHTLLTTTDGNAGVAVSPDGDIQNLYNNDGPENAGDRLIQAAIDVGGRTLDCYDGFLPDFYAEHGFRETGRMEFDPQCAPETWDAEAFGHPDVVFMAYQPQAPVSESDDYYTEWNEAKAQSAHMAN